MPALPTLLYTDPKSGRLLRRRWTVTVLDGVDAGRTAILDQSPALIGAAPAASLVLTDDTVSRYHLELDVFAEGLRLRDLDSTNGTFVGSTRIKEGFVEPGETFRLGRTTLRAIGHEEAAPDVETDPQGVPLGGVDRIGGAIAVSVAMRALFEDLRKVARSPSSVLLEGDVGAGKATCARALHDLGLALRSNGEPRATGAKRVGAFVAVTVPPGLSPQEADALVFGGEPSAWERAADGTLFIEHVDRLPQIVQRRLLRAIELGELPAQKPEPKRRRIDVRWIASTSSPAARVTLEPRLLKRLGVVRLRVPSLEERSDELGPLVEAFLSERGDHAFVPGPRLIASLAKRPWPANLDGLRTALDGLARPPEWLGATPEVDPLRAALITDAIARHAGSVTRAARELGTSTGALFALAARWDLDVDAADVGLQNTNAAS